MRQVFTSQRLETVEGVAKLLTDHDIEIYISHPRSYRSKRGSQFSYNQPIPLNKQPALWVRHAEDQPRARELLRAAGLLDSTRPGSAAPLTFADAEDTAPKRRSWAWRIRLILLALIAGAAVLTVTRHRAPPAAPPVPPAPAPQAPAKQQPAEEEIRVPIRPAGG